MEQELTKAKLSARMASDRGAMIPPSRFHEIGRHALAMVIQLADLEIGADIATVTRLAPKTQRLVKVTAIISLGGEPIVAQQQPINQVNAAIDHFHGSRIALPAPLIKPSSI